MFAVSKELDLIYQQVVNWRRQIHQHPELGHEEYQTSALVKSVLEEAGIQVSTYPNSTAVVGILNGGKKGKTIALRADMDALPITEMFTGEFKSQVEGKMHACGHDAHTAILLGVASIMAKHKESVPGVIKFLFQPGEEVFPGGAEAMVAAGALKDPDVEHVLGLHVSPALAVGEVGVPYGYVTANSDRANIRIIGKGGHGSAPENTVDAVMVATQVVNSLQTIISRNVSALDSAVISVGSIHGGTINNIIADTVDLQLTIRSLRPETRQLLRARIEEITDYTTKAMRAKYQLEYIYGHPALPNDDRVVDVVKAVASKVVGEHNVRVSYRPDMGGEDFSYFAREVPSAFFWLGSTPKDVAEPFPAHNPNFELDERCLLVGMEMLVKLVMQAEKIQ